MKMRKNLSELDPKCHHHFEPDESLSTKLDTKGHDHYLCSICNGYKKVRKCNGEEAKRIFNIIKNEKDLHADIID